jgi:hypothetical protein
MLDLETLGTLPGSAILSIGAVPFNPITGRISCVNFYCNLMTAPQLERGMTENEETKKWWSEQSAEARARLSNPSPLGVHMALALFREFWRDQGIKYIWSHGAGFDVVLMEHLMRAFSFEIPWHHRDVLDTRTVYHMTGLKPRKDMGLAHYAVDDAREQAWAVCEGYHDLGLTEHNWLERTIMSIRFHKTGYYYER